MNAPLGPTEPGSTLTSPLHDAPPASEEISLQSVSGPVASGNWAGSLEPTPEIAIASVPSLVTVTSCASVAPGSMSWSPKVNVAGERDQAVCVPSPDTPTVKSETPPVVVEIVTVADFGPTEPGSN